MENYLIITALGADRPGIVKQLSGLVADNGCNIHDSRMTALGGEFALILMVSGKWNELARLEDVLSTQAEALNLKFICKRTQDSVHPTPLLPYSVEAISIDQAGVMHQIASFFSGRGVNIQEMNSTRYAAAHTGTPMFAMHIFISIPADTHIATLREDFLDYCESLNIDASIEPVKP